MLPVPDSNPATPLRIAVVVLLAVVVIALSAGRAPLSLIETLHSPSPEGAVLWQLRLPRVLAAMLIGGGLALAGVAAQSALRNPLASPDVLGVGAGAAVGASLGLVLGLPLVAVSGLAFAFALAVTALVASVSIRAARTSKRDPVLVALLVGMAVGSFAAAALAAIKWFADPVGKLPAITFWLLGSLSAVGWREVVVLAVCVAIGAALLARVQRTLAALALGDDVAQTMGVPVLRVRWQALAAMSLLAAVVTSIAGLVPWVALMTPHAARLLLHGRASQPWALATLLGAISVLVVDTICRSVSVVELPLGVLLSIAGVPGFLWLVGRRGTPP
jgi:iron complex transport system permease protein